MHQILFYIGDFPIRAYGMVLASSIILSTGVAYFLAKRQSDYAKYIVDLGLYCGLAGLLGARLWDVFFFDWAYYSHHLGEIFFVWQGGMAIQGGVVAGFITGYCYCRYHKLDPWLMMDIIAPALILGQALGRCANLLNGDAFGAPTGSSFGIIYPAATLAARTYGEQPLWPAEIWEGQLDIVIFALLLIYRSFPTPKGSTFALYLGLYSFIRFLLEFLRGDYMTPMLFGLDSAQVTSAAGMILALLLLIYCYATHPREYPVPGSQTVSPSAVSPENKRHKKKK